MKELKEEQRSRRKARGSGKVGMTKRVGKLNEKMLGN